MPARIPSWPVPTSFKGAGSGPVPAALSPMGARRALSTGRLHPVSGTQRWLWMSCAPWGWDATAAGSTLTHPRCPAGWVPVAFTPPCSSTWLEKQHHETWGRELLRSRRVWAPPRAGEGGPSAPTSGPGRNAGMGCRASSIARREQLQGSAGETVSPATGYAPPH